LKPSPQAQFLSSNFLSFILYPFWTIKTFQIEYTNTVNHSYWEELEKRVWEFRTETRHKVDNRKQWRFWGRSHGAIRAAKGL
jgi:hypothetical protein